LERSEFGLANPSPSTFHMVSKMTSMTTGVGKINAPQRIPYINIYTKPPTTRVIILKIEFLKELMPPKRSRRS